MHSPCKQGLFTRITKLTCMCKHAAAIDQTGEIVELTSDAEQLEATDATTVLLTDKDGENLQIRPMIEGAI